VRSRYIHKEQLRNAIAHVANAIFEARLPEIWGEGTRYLARIPSQDSHIGP
jgi:TnpA family transposase